VIKLNKHLTGTVVLLTLAACADEPASEVAEVAPKRVSGISFENMDTNIRPGDDFFSYVNGTWIEETEIPKDEPAYGGFSLLDDESQEHVRAIIDESAAGDFAHGTDEQKVGDLYKSYMNMDERNARGVDPLKTEFEKINAISNHSELAVYFASAEKLGYTTPFSLGQYADFKDPTTYMMYVLQSGLGLPNREYYLNEDEKSIEIRNKYVAHVEAMFALADLPNGAAAAQTIMALENRLATEQMRKEDARDMVLLYKKIPVAELNDLMPKFNWSGYLAESDLQDLDGLVVMMRDYMRALDDIVANTDIDTWKTYLTWAVLDSTAGRLTAELDQQNFAFYGTTLLGIEKQRDMWRRGVGVVNGVVGEVVGKVYVKKHFPPEAKNRMLEIVANLVRAYEMSIRNLDWMTERKRWTNFRSSHQK